MTLHYLRLERKYNLSYNSTVSMLQKELKKKRKDWKLIVDLSKIIGFRNAQGLGRDTDITDVPDGLGLQHCG